MRKHVLIGTGAAVLLLLVYLGIITLAQGWTHAVEQTGRLWYWVAALAAGFGTQAGLFSFIKQGVHQRQVAAGSSVGASGVISSGSMAACCAHHLSDVLPLLGLSGLAIFLTRYQLFFIVVGVLSNIVGITIMLETIQRHGLSQRIAASRWNMNVVKKGAMISSGIVSAVFLLVLVVS
ncbi:MAG: hypothetical protein HYX84_07245 [Chloroflexi bacterium]|nr:hypothetical protein [Chloroflexota bacterium]